MFIHLIMLTPVRPTLVMNFDKGEYIIMPKMEITNHLIYTDNRGIILRNKNIIRKGEDMVTFELNPEKQAYFIKINNREVCLDVNDNGRLIPCVDIKIYKTLWKVRRRDMGYNIFTEMKSGVETFRKVEFCFYILKRGTNPFVVSYVGTKECQWDDEREMFHIIRREPNSERKPDPWELRT